MLSTTNWFEWKSDKVAYINRLQAVPFRSVERVRSQRTETGARKNKREETGGEAGRKGTALLTATNTFEFSVAPATENSDWSINNSCYQTSLMYN